MLRGRNVRRGCRVANSRYGIALALVAGAIAGPSPASGQEIDVVEMTVADVAAGYRQDGSGAVVNASRSINFPTASEGDWRAAVESAARAAREDLYDAGLPA